MKIDLKFRHSKVKFTDIEVGEIFADGLEFFLKLTLSPFEREKLRWKHYHGHCFDEWFKPMPSAIENLDIYNAINLNTGEILAMDTTFQKDVIYITPVCSEPTKKKIKFKNIAIGDTFVYNNTVFMKGAKHYYRTFRTCCNTIGSEKCQDTIFKKGVELKTGKVINFEESTLVSPIKVNFERIIMSNFYK